MLSILLIDDNPQDRLLVVRSLEQEFPTLQVEEIIKSEDFDSALEIGQFDLVITDYQLRWSDGLFVLRAVKSRYPDCPVIMFTNSGTQEIAVEAMKSGLEDYVLKSAKHYIRLAVSVRSVWEKAQTKRKVKGLENRLQGLLNQLNVGVFRLMLDGSLLEGNPALWSLLGHNDKFQVQEIQSLESYFLPQDYGQFLKELNENKQIQNCEVQLRQANGNLIWVRLSLTINTINDHTIVDGLMEDISDRIRVQEERYRREQEFKALAENALDVIARLDKNMRYLYVNPAMETATGVSPEQFIGKKPSELGFPKSIYVHWQEQMQKILTTQQEGFDEFEFPSPSGIRYYQSHLVPEFALDGSVESILSVTRDVTEYKQVEQALRESESRFKRLVESNVIGCMFWDANGNIFDANDAFLQMVGYTREDLRAGKVNWKNMTPVEQLPLSEKAIAQMKQVGAADPLEKEYIRSDGSRVPILLGGVLLKGSQDKGVSFVLDLSQQKQLENQLRQQAEQLEQANRVKDEFLAVLSHELRSPLNSILGWSKLLRSRKLDEATITRALETIERNATMQTQLIEDLLDVSRILQGKTSLNVCSVDLAWTIEAAIDTVRLSAQAKSIQLECLSELTASIVLGDPNRLQQVIWNLLSNAIKFTPSGGRVSIHLKHQGTQAQIQVSDTGKGISAEFLPHVFEYFRQADSSTTRTQGGLGLGLAIVRHLVELHGGTVLASSPGVGKGATFTVTLPLKIDPAQLKDAQQVLLSGNGAQILNNPSVLEGKRVLVVDDDADTRDFYTTVLEECGACVIVAASVSEALEALKQQRPDVLVSDIGMPSEDGYTLISKVRALESEGEEHIPAVALTAYAREVDRQKAIAAGFQEHLPKPVEPAELVAVVAHLVGQTSPMNHHL